MAEYRSVFYYRLGFDSRAISWLAPADKTSFITCDNIGEGFFVNHGHSTQINAKSIGRNFQVWHNVTIGVKTQFDDNTRPVIGDNVKICSGACVCGDIAIGNDVTIGANSVVMKSVPDGCVVVGNPAYIISRNGLKCKESL
ncbi:MAG: serine acetyltransferase [Bacteroidales bacterium]|nr:serine acetyltransferase [Bacteroidales bacterium]